MEKDSERFPKTGSWGYAVFYYDAAADKFTTDPTALADCGNAVLCGSERERLRLPPVSETLNRAGHQAPLAKDPCVRLCLRRG